MKRYIFHFYINRRIIHFKCINAYSSFLCLVCFGLILQLVGFGSILAYQYGYLSLSNRQSIFDLSCIDHAKHIISHNSYIRTCNLDESELIVEKNVEIDAVDVVFIDHETYLSCLYNDIELRIYYDEKAIREIEYVTIDEYEKK